MIDVAISYECFAMSCPAPAAVSIALRVPDDVMLEVGEIVCGGCGQTMDETIPE